LLSRVNELPNLFALLPKLRAVVLVGAQAAKAEVVVEALDRPYKKVG
jgi:hypothetical protein